MKKIILHLACAAMLSGAFASCSFAESENREYPDKDLWYLDTENIAWCNYPNMYEHFEAMGNADLGFDIDQYINSELGEGVMQTLKYIILYQETDEEISDYWEALGIKKIYIIQKMKQKNLLFMLRKMQRRAEKSIRLYSAFMEEEIRFLPQNLMASPSLVQKKTLLQ